MSTKTKDEIVRLRINGAEKSRLVEEADRLGISVSAFLRLLIKQWDDGIHFEKRTTDVMGNGVD